MTTTKENNVESEHNSVQNYSSDAEKSITANDRKERLQWHPAFYAGLQIEFEEEADKLIFEREHNLSTKPMQIDVLIIKKKADDEIHKNIGRIFRKYNIIEYKSPTDYLSIDDYYKVYGYTCFYKSSSKFVNDIRVTDLTITFACHSYPEEFANHLTKVHGFLIEKKSAGIYYINRDVIPIQLLITSELDENENLWLSHLTNNLTSVSSVERLTTEYGKHDNEELYKSVMNIIIRANKELFKEVDGMLEALEELFADKLEESMNKGIQIGIKSTILSCKKLGASWDTVSGMVQENFSITAEEAEEYMKLYW